MLSGVTRPSPMLQDLQVSKWIAVRGSLRLPREDLSGPLPPAQLSITRVSNYLASPASPSPDSRSRQFPTGSLVVPSQDDPTTGVSGHWDSLSDSLGDMLCLSANREVYR